MAVMPEVAIADLPLKPRAKRLLMTKYQTIGQFTTEGEILKIKGFGRKSHRALLAAIGAFGIKLPVL